MSDVGKGMLIVLVILYIVSPIDFAPGPVDDAIVLLLGMAAAKKIRLRDELPINHNKNGGLL